MTRTRDGINAFGLALGFFLMPISTLIVLNIKHPQSYTDTWEYSVCGDVDTQSLRSENGIFRGKIRTAFPDGLHPVDMTFLDFGAYELFAHTVAYRQHYDRAVRENRITPSFEYPLSEFMVRVRCTAPIQDRPPYECVAVAARLGCDANATE